MSARPPSPYVLLSFDGLDLALRHSDVSTIEPVADVILGPERAGAIGRIDFSGEDRPVYCLDRNLSSLDWVPQGRRACVLLGGTEHIWALLCDRVQILTEQSVRAEPLAACMRVTGCPITGLAVHAGRLAVLTTADELGRFLSDGRGGNIRPKAA
jgi:hypothetical protein